MPRLTLREVSALGLVDDRKRARRVILEHTLCEPCPICHGRGTLKTAEDHLLRDLPGDPAPSPVSLRSRRCWSWPLGGGGSPAGRGAGHLAELAEFIGKPIRLQAESLYTQERYDVVLI